MTVYWLPLAKRGEASSVQSQDKRVTALGTTSKKSNSVGSIFHTETLRPDLLNDAGHVGDWWGLAVKSILLKKVPAKNGAKIFRSQLPHD